MLDSLLSSAFLWTALAAVLAGLIRGFSGFGAAMVFLPVASAVYEPRQAVILLYIADSIASLPMMLPALRRCEWREVIPVALGATLTIPLGVALLASTDPLLLRWLISGLILLSVLALASGWRYQRRPPPLACVGVGGMAGFCSGLAGLAGPPVILFWLTGQALAATVRANIIAFFAYTTLINGLSYAWHGLFNSTAILLGLCLIPCYAMALQFGVRRFSKTSEQFYRRLAFTLIGLIAISSLPVFGTFWQQILHGLGLASG